MRITFLAAAVFGSGLLLAQPVRAGSFCTVRTASAKVQGAPEIDIGRVHRISSGSSRYGTRPSDVTVFGRVEGSSTGRMDVINRWGGDWPDDGRPFIVEPRRELGEKNSVLQYSFSEGNKTVEITAGQGIETTGGVRRLAKKIGTAKADCHEDSSTGLDRAYNTLLARYIALEVIGFCVAEPTDETKSQFAALAADASLTPITRAEKLTPRLCVTQVENFNRLNVELAAVGWDVKGDVRAGIYRALLRAFEAQDKKAAQ